MPPDSIPGPAAYELRLVQTSASTGYFAAVPAPEGSWETALAYLREHPLDEFMHRHLLRYLAGLDQEQQKRLFRRLDVSDPLVRVLLAELAVLDPGGSFSKKVLSADLSGEAAHRSHTPLIDLKSHALSDQELHRRWIAVFAENLNSLSPLPDEHGVGMSPPVPEEAIAVELNRGINIGDLPISAPVEAGSE
ncbi:MAG: hypothetical protein K9K88_18230, partial [Desulfobacterales bacterium]|nr:hypothetical protein [Desulfobacterales bacterium]